MEQVNDRNAGISMDADAEFERQVAALDGAPTGMPLQSRDYIFLVATGIVIPALLLLWGWS